MQAHAKIHVEVQRALDAMRQHAGEQAPGCPQPCPLGSTEHTGHCGMPTSFSFTCSCPSPAGRTPSNKYSHCVCPAWSARMTPNISGRPSCRHAAQPLAPLRDTGTCSWPTGCRRQQKADHAAPYLCARLPEVLRLHMHSAVGCCWIANLPRKCFCCK